MLSVKQAKKNKKNKNVSPVIHLYIRGNCGNQFFQYSFARNMQELMHAKLVINYYRINHDSTVMAESRNLLSAFNTVDYTYEDRFDFGIFIFKFLNLIKIIFHLKDYDKRTYMFYLWCAEVLPRFGIFYFDSAYYHYKYYRRKNIYICGYYESPRYFMRIDDKLCTELTSAKGLLPQNEAVYSEIQRRNSVCVSIKRMAVENERIADVYQYDISYFYRAVEYICSRVENPLFCVFSDDVNWCRKNFILEQDVWYETGNDPIWEKIRLMSACKHFIIHNSTFSWWAQHLSRNEGKIVIAPNRWMIRDDQPIDLYEEGWVFLSPEGSFTNNHE